MLFPITDYKVNKLRLKTKQKDTKIKSKKTQRQKIKRLLEIEKIEFGEEP